MQVGDAQLAEVVQPSAYAREVTREAVGVAVGLLERRGEVCLSQLETGGESLALDGTQ